MCENEDRNERFFLASFFRMTGRELLESSISFWMEKQSAEQKLEMTLVPTVRDQKFIVKQSIRVTCWQGSAKVQGKFGIHLAEGMDESEKLYIWLRETASVMADRKILG